MWGEHAAVPISIGTCFGSTSLRAGPATLQPMDIMRQLALALPCLQVSARKKTFVDRLFGRAG